MNQEKLDTSNLYKNRFTKWKQKELVLIIFYAIAFYAYVIKRSLTLSHDHYQKLYGLAPGWLIPHRPNDVSDAQWRNFRGNLPILTFVFAIFTLISTGLRLFFQLRAKGMAFLWLSLSFFYLTYLHGACIIYILLIATANFVLVKRFARTVYFPFILWIFNIFFLVCNRIYEGYSFSIFGRQFEFLDNFRGTFRWHICFNFVVLRMISFGCDYHWVQHDSRFDQEKHMTRCSLCKSGKICYVLRQERSIANDHYSFPIYLCYLLYAPLYIAGPIISFNAFASQLDVPQNTHSVKHVARYGLRWLFSFLLMELMTHLFYYNAFAISRLWKELSPLEIFIIGYGVLNFMWLKFLLIWRYFRFWSLVNGIETVENMPRCINNCYNLETFWKNWHASFNRWLVRYMYIPLGGSRRKLLNVWVVFTFVAVWHDLEWKLLSWAWITCLFFVPEMLVKSASNAFKAESVLGEFLFRELAALSGAVTITSLMIANLVGYVIGPSGLNWLVSGFLTGEGVPVLGVLFFSFYLATKLMLHIKEWRN
ncbi:PREDICTED: putative membrane-bound O-acyltransferase C24H6.01c [Tarenaya hassleriana]|uniref:putative membrane-bound O-acyltransferase C24H6.01c n=1 Tax=Tarenaya hassleriana TaxID=28532 RepID=UPI00053C8484|nr:PREDICTED: putative membrane-bound O-acyltransferase C24H6.01c [Tarenaya hassleriana]